MVTTAKRNGDMNKYRLCFSALLRRKGKTFSGEEGGENEIFF
ncbi:hypothetical protein E308F_12100 [Moorella sp. E308F]|nr:hypothetical protein E308F_12100 [Moorella sp. E308F]